MIVTEATGEQFTRLKFRVSPKEWANLIMGRAVHVEPAVYRKGDGFVQYRTYHVQLNGRREELSFLGQGWYQVELERKDLLYRDNNHRWLMLVKAEIGRVANPIPSPKDLVPLEFRPLEDSGHEVIHRRANHVLHVRGHGRRARVTYHITELHKVAAMVEDLGKEPPPPPASEAKLRDLANFFATK